MTNSSIDILSKMMTASTIRHKVHSTILQISILPTINDKLFLLGGLRRL